MWKGSISFGLVNIPVALYKATDEDRVPFNLLHQKDLSPIGFARVCKEEGIEVPNDEIVRGFKLENGEYVVMEEEDFERADVKRTKTIDLLTFTDTGQIDTMFYESPYYLAPTKGAEKPYALLAAALSKSDKVGIGKFVLRNKEHLAAVKPHGQILILNQLRFADEVRPADELKVPDADVDERELELATALIEQRSEEFQPDQYHDTYTAEIRRIIEEKAEGREPTAQGELPPPTKVTDLMATLKASLEAGKKQVA